MPQYRCPLLNRVSLPYLPSGDVRLLQEPQTLSVISQHLQDFFCINCTPTIDPFALWNTHKSYTRGILIQLVAKEKKRHSIKLNNTLSDIHKMETQNKISPTTAMASTLSKLRENLQELFTQKYDKHLRRLKLNSYANANRAGKYLASRIKAARTKTIIAYLTHSTLHHKISNPQEIANQFADYYGALYNQNKDKSTPQPNIVNIQQFLQKINLPSLTEDQLTQLNSPFSAQEIEGNYLMVSHRVRMVS